MQTGSQEGQRGYQSAKIYPVRYKKKQVHIHSKQMNKNGYVGERKAMRRISDPQNVIKCDGTSSGLCNVDERDRKGHAHGRLSSGQLDGVYHQKKTYEYLRAE